MSRFISNIFKGFSCSGHGVVANVAHQAAHFAPPVQDADMLFDTQMHDVASSPAPAPAPAAVARDPDPVLNETDGASDVDEEGYLGDVEGDEAPAPVAVVRDPVPAETDGASSAGSGEGSPQVIRMARQPSFVADDDDGSLPSTAAVVAAASAGGDVDDGEEVRDDRASPNVILGPGQQAVIVAGAEGGELTGHGADIAQDETEGEFTLDRATGLLNFPEGYLDTHRVTVVTGGNPTGDALVLVEDPLNRDLVRAPAVVHGVRGVAFAPFHEAVAAELEAVAAPNAGVAAAVAGIGLVPISATGFPYPADLVEGALSEFGAVGTPGVSGLLGGGNLAQHAAPAATGVIGSRGAYKAIAVTVVALLGISIYVISNYGEQLIQLLGSHGSDDKDLGDGEL